MSFNFTKLSIPEVVLIEPKVFADSRGFFIETYKHSEFTAMGIPEHFLQDNHSYSIRNVLRGLHYQKSPKAQGKLVRCVKGAIWDVAVDIRRKSATYGKWVSAELSELNKMMLYVPAGFAHGFVVLSDQADVIYKCTEEYSPANDRGIIWNDPDIAIAWPVQNPLVSEKDKKHPSFKQHS
ncbi:MAG: dTDP-4-dehydrorhamnose 3,5-epimerase [Candidatus Brocadiia bacterium]